MDYRNVKSARLMKGIKLSKIESSWGICKGDVQLPGGDIRSVYIKLISTPSIIMREIFSCLVAKFLAIKVPEPYLVYVPEDYDDYHDAFKGKKVLGKFLYGMEIIEYPDLSRNFSEGVFKNTSLKDDFLKNKSISLMGVFDELIVNEDRHHENVLLDGVNICLIDHESSFLKRKDMNSLECKNWFLNLYENSGEPELKRFERSLKRVVRKEKERFLFSEFKEQCWSDIRLIAREMGYSGDPGAKQFCEDFLFRGFLIERLVLKSFDSISSGQGELIL